MRGFCPLASGSRGNALYLGTDDTKILIDAGLSGKATCERLAAIGVNIEDIDAILVTHDHHDHIAGIKRLTQKYHLPILANTETAKGIVQSVGHCPKFKIFTTGETFEFGDLEIHPFSVQHDTLDPCAFTIKTGGIKFGICSDLGFVTSVVKHQLQGCDYLYLEANHEVAFVHACNRSHVYKHRVLSRQGHISNEEAAALINEIWHPKLKHVWLAHLSSECNSPEKALEVIERDVERKLSVSIAPQGEVALSIELPHASSGDQADILVGNNTQAN